ncbi:MAG: hypothetical protein IJU40_08320, partial [Desulfovibrionaceae bacterium]|nr:hypothetical protein [Desulfovibrionaceae bacterium]
KGTLKAALTTLGSLIITYLASFLGLYPPLAVTLALSYQTLSLSFLLQSKLKIYKQKIPLALKSLAKASCCAVIACGQTPFLLSILKDLTKSTLLSLTLSILLTILLYVGLLKKFSQPNLRRILALKLKKTKTPLTSKL